MTNQQIAEEAGASVKTVKWVKAGMRAGLTEEIKGGKVSAKRAAEIAKLPEPERKTAVESPAAREAKPDDEEGESDSPAAGEHAASLDEAYGDFDALDALEKARAEILRLQTQLTAAEADDLKAEAIRWRKVAENAEREQGLSMSRAKQFEDMHARKHKMLMRCGKAVGEEDPTKVAAAVEAFVRQHRKAAP